MIEFNLNNSKDSRFIVRHSLCPKGKVEFLLPLMMYKVYCHGNSISSHTVTR